MNKYLSFLLFIFFILLIISGLCARISDRTTSLHRQPFFSLGKLLYNKSQRFFKNNKASIIKSQDLQRQIKQLNPGTNIEEKYKQHIITSISCGITAFSLSLFIISLVLYKSTVNEPLTTLKRPDVNESSETHNITAYINGKKENLDIFIKPRLLTQEELLKIYENISDDILTELLKDNPDINYVSRDLNFINTICNSESLNKMINITWTIDDSSLISPMGNLIYDNINPQGSNVKISARLQLDGYDFSATKIFILKLFPRIYSSGEILSTQINDNINNEEKIYSKTINLSDDSGFDSVTYYKKTAPFPIILIPLCALFIALSIYAGHSNIKRKLSARNIQLAYDYPRIVSKLTLLYSAGLNLQNAFRKIIYDYESINSKSRFAYEEIKVMIKSIENGISEGDAYISFGQNCFLPCYIKLGTLLNQNLKSGHSEIYKILEYECYSSMENKKIQIKTAAEKASTKAVFPLVLLLITVFIIVLSPALVSM